LKFWIDMPMNHSEKRSKKSSIEWLVLDLPAVTEAAAPIDHPPPSAALAFRHSLELLHAVSDDAWMRRREAMNPKQFVLV
jgi:hypothetical protein